MKKILLTLSLSAIAAMSFAQRVTDKLDRGLIAQKTTTGVYVNWRILGEEYYDVKYNIYRDGTKLNDDPLNVSNYTDKSGTTSSKYTVSAVVRGVEQAQCAAVTPWTTSYTEIKLTHEGIKSILVPNDACCADVDGDGEVEILMKFDNQSEAAQSYPKNGPKIDGVDTKEYSIFEILKLDGTRLWWVNCGPNMGDFQNNEQNIVAYDWDGDGKAEAVFRAADGTTIHAADGKEYVIGDKTKNFRAATGGGTNWFMHSGAEYLVYVNGETGVPYQIIDYPLRRLEASENPNNLESGSTYDGLVDSAWGDGYGHRSSKYFFGAPYLDGRKPSIFLARGIYTQIKMRAYDVDPATHTLVQRWDWRSTNGGYWMWQGYHNFGVADVDEDGRDEIVYGSMVIDDNGKGLSTTGLGHGDAQHCSDFNPYAKGLEIYACNEDQPGNNYRDATTSKIYHRYQAGNDDGRAMMGNFSDKYPGSIGCSAREGAISSVTNEAVSGMDATGINTNFRIYWDGDLCSETFNYLNGKNTEGCIAKYGSWTPIYTCTGSLTNNDTKGTPCYQGDILGDWREEIIMRTASNNIRIYSTPTPTTYRIPTLWSDHQYRNAMVWQMCGYNQPPHISYFIGRLEGITQAPPPLTMTGREEVSNGGTVGASLNDKHAIVCETNDTKISLADGAKPYILTINVPSWVQGSASSNYTAKDSKIDYQYYTCDVTSGSLAGDARLVKQGDGILNLPNSNFTHTGETNIWAGTVNFDGSMTSSPLWLNRFATLNSNGGKFKSIKTEYASRLIPGGENAKGTITTDSLSLGFGSRIIVDLYSDDVTADLISTKYLSIEKKAGIWATAGPEYTAPVIELVGHLADGQTSMTPGKYVIGTVSGDIVGSVENIKLEGLATTKKNLSIENGQLIVEILGMRDASTIVWTGATNSIWDFAETENFAINDGTSTEATTFVSNDSIIFNDDATNKSVLINSSIIPGTFTVDNTAAYTFSGTGSIDGDAQFIKEGTGTVTISNANTYTGGNHLKGGVTRVSSLSNQYSASGNLGGITKAASLFTIENGAVLQTTAAVEMGSPMQMVGTDGGVINNSADFQMDVAFSGTKLTKRGNGWLKAYGGGSLRTLSVEAGTVDASSKVASAVVVSGSSALTGNGFLTTPIEVADKAKAKLTTVNRQNTSLALTGTGQITIYCATEKGSDYYATRTPIILNLRNFEGTLVPEATYAADGRFTFDTSNGGAGWTLNIPASRIVQNSGKTLRIGALTGTGTLGGFCAFRNGVSSTANTWQVGNDTDFKFDGDVTSNDNFTKMGSGKMTVTKAWSSTGAIRVNAGELHVNSGATLGTGSLTVARGATFSAISGAMLTTAAKNPMTNSSIAVNGTLQIGATANAISGILNAGGKNMTFASGSSLRLGVRGATSGTTIKNAYLYNVGRLTMNGTISLFFKDYEPEVGDEIRLWNEVTTFSGSPSIECDTEGYTFDTSRIAEGIITVTSVPVVDAIAEIPASEIVTVDVLSIGGAILDQFSCPMSAVNSTFRQSSLPSGVYLLRITGATAKGIKKTIK